MAPAHDAVIELDYLEQLPAGFLQTEARDLYRILSGPTLIRLDGRMRPPLFVSVLMHGNETTGFDALRAVLRRYADTGLPRQMIVFVANIEAARADVRTLPGQLDYNRAWPGTESPDTPEAALMRAVCARIARQSLFASIDVHNNTGRNPHYACVNRLDDEFLNLASLFSRTIVYFTHPFGVQSAAMAELCPAVTVECGKSGVAANTAHAEEFLQACLHLSTFPTRRPGDRDIDLLRTFAVIRVPEPTSFSFDGGAADIRFRLDIDKLNFQDVAAGTPIAEVDCDSVHRLTVEPGGDSDSVEKCLDYCDGEIRFCRTAMPAMLTRDVNAVKMDCLCYLMRRIAPDKR